MTISELIELLQEIMEKEGDIDVEYVHNDNGDILHGEKRVCGLEVRLTPLRQGRRDLVRRTRNEERKSASTPCALRVGSHRGMRHVVSKGLERLNPSDHGGSRRRYPQAVLLRRSAEGLSLDPHPDGKGGREMPVEMKKEIRKRIACMMGTTQKAIREAEAKCDGRAFMYHAKGTLCGFYLLHVPVKGKIAPTFFPIEYFVKQKEEEQ